MKLLPDGTLTPFASACAVPMAWALTTKAGCGPSTTRATGLAPARSTTWRQGSTTATRLRWCGRKALRASRLTASAAELDALRQLPAGVFPQGTMANSPCDPIVIPESWGPLAGDLLIGEMNHERICRAMVQEVRGRTRATITTMIDGGGLRMGNNRLAFAQDGTLWVGHTDHGWTGAKGITKITPTGQPFLAFTACDLTADGFALSTTRPLTDEELAKRT